MRLSAFILGAFVVWPSWAFGESMSVFCQFDDAQAVVACIRVGDAAPIFQFKLPNLDVAILSSIASSIDRGSWSRLAGEQCRLRVENFRETDIEASFRTSLESLRIKAESLRETSPANLALYTQIMLLYHGLFDRYWGGIQTYKSTINSCARRTPFEVHPDRLSIILKRGGVS
jgi:hypothetical protein